MQHDPNNLFGRVILNNKGIEKNERIKLAFENCYQEVMKYTTGDDRAKAMVATHMEIASMFAQKAMSRDEANQSKDDV